MEVIKQTPLEWMKDVNPKVLEQMLPHKLKMDYKRPTFLDSVAQEAIIIGQRSACLFNEVGAVIYSNKVSLSTGFNGPAKGDHDPREVNCARIVNGELQKGAGLCRGSHAELNAIGNLSAGTQCYESLGMIVTLRPCNSCAKQIVNKGIKELYYIWEYDQDHDVIAYLKRLGVKAEKYESEILTNFIKRNPDCIPVQLRKSLA